MEWIIPNVIMAMAAALILLVPGTQAQWMHDNRCFGPNSRLLSESTTTNNITHSFSANDLERFLQKSSDASLNVMAEAEEDRLVYWYDNLRGRKRGKGQKNHHRYLSVKPVEQDPNSFMLKLHWEENYCWQGERIERKWCIECQSGGNNCAAGDKLVTQFCADGPGQQFVWIPNMDVTDDSENYGQLKLAQFDLCIERMTTNTYLLQKCDANSPYQTMVGWHPSRPFELHPVENTNKCVNMHHHPRPEEEIANTACETALQFRTNLWEVYTNENAGQEIVSLRNPQCSENQPCVKCQGDCDTDNDCVGNLICMKRTADDVYAPIPGCQGFPHPGADFCYEPDEDFLEPNELRNQGLRLRKMDCSPSAPCNVCEGDCDGDNSCFGELVCKLRGKDNPLDKVPGCIGEGIPEADYCYNPDPEERERDNRSRLRLKNRDCNEENPCYKCQGDCDNDNQCYGDLECFQRRLLNPTEAVPGCAGLGNPGSDYCYLPGDKVATGTDAETIGGAQQQKPLTPPPSNSPVQDDSQEDGLNDNTAQHNLEEDSMLMNPLEPPLDSTIKNCSEESKCGLCQGDCQVDADCSDFLVCFQREWYQPYKKVPGCAGRGTAGADYCIEP